jgi:hypothetical protein
MAISRLQSDSSDGTEGAVTVREGGYAPNAPVDLAVQLLYDRLAAGQQ